MKVSLSMTFSVARGPCRGLGGARVLHSGYFAQSGRAKPHACEQKGPYKVRTRVSKGWFFRGSTPFSGGTFGTLK